MTKGVGIAVAGTAFGVPMWGVALAVGGLLVLGAAGGKASSIYAGPVPKSSWLAPVWPSHPDVILRHG